MHALPLIAAALALGGTLVIAGPPADVLLALLGKGGRDQPADRAWSDRKARALQYLAKVEPNDEIQPKLWRLLVRRHLGPAAADLGGSRVDDEGAVLKVTAWSLDPKVKLLPEATEKKEPWSDKVLPVIAYFSLATDQAEPSPLPAEIRAVMIAHFLEKQEADGSWLSYVAHPPMSRLDATSDSAPIALTSATAGLAIPPTTTHLPLLFYYSIRGDSCNS